MFYTDKSSVSVSFILEVFILKFYHISPLKFTNILFIWSSFKADFSKNNFNFDAVISVLHLLQKFCLKISSGSNYMKLRAGMSRSLKFLFFRNISDF